MNTPSRTDSELMTAYANGERAAFSILFQRYAPTLLRTLEHGLLRKEDARDLLQQTFLHAHKARHDFRLGAPFRPWIVTIAYNLKRDYLRRHKVRKESSLDHEPQDAAKPLCEQIASRQQNAAMRAAIEKLPTPQREVIELHWMAGLSYKDIAKLIGISMGNAKVRAHRAYATLRSHLETSEDTIPPRRAQDAATRMSAR